MPSDQKVDEPSGPGPLFLRLYSWAFCAALWVGTVGSVVGVVATDGEERKPFAFFAVVVGSMAVAATLLLVAIERKRAGAPVDEDHQPVP